MKSMHLLALVGCTVLAAPSFAQTFSNDWSFVDDGTGQTVSGFVSGLNNGTDLSAQGLTFTVTQSPYADMLGDYALDIGSPYAGDIYSASDGVVTRLDIFYQNAGQTINFWLGTGGFLSGTAYPQIESANENAYSFATGATFSAREDIGGGTGSDVPEPASWAMMVGGFALAGAAMRRARTSVRFA